MVDGKRVCHLCGECPEVNGQVWQGYVFCSFLNQDVWAGSIMCKHGEDLLEMF